MESLPVETVVVRSVGVAEEVALQNFLCVLTNNEELVLDELDVEPLPELLFLVFTSCCAARHNL